MEHEKPIQNLTIRATASEVRNMDLIRKFYKRKTVSDAFRFLIEQEAEKILALSFQIKKNSSIEEASK